MKFQKTAVAIAHGVSTSLWFALQWLFAAVVGTIAGISAAAQGAGHLAHAGQFGVGPNPASQTSAQSPQAALVIYYNSKFT